MMNRFKIVQQRHQRLMEALDDNTDLESAKQLLEDLAAAGAEVSALEQRSRLRAYIRFWSSYIQDHTGEYPIIRLYPSQEETSVTTISEDEEERVPSDDSVERIIDEYKLVDQIGRGGFSIVYLAEHIETKERVAIKLFKKRELEDEHFHEMLKSEALALELDHPHILPVHKVGVIDNMAYMVSKYIPAGSLADRLSQYYWRPRIGEIIELFKQLAKALSYLHERNIVHRDIKPGNILIDHETRAYLVDFGVAVIIERLYSGSIVIGTPEYIAPEVVQSPDLTSSKSDVYSLGIVMYAILNGKLPFSGQSPKEILIAQLYQAPASINPNIPTDLVEIVYACLVKNPNERIDAKRLYGLLLAVEAWLTPEELAQRLGGYTTPIEQRTDIPVAGVHDTSKIPFHETVSNCSVCAAIFPIEEMFCPNCGAARYPAEQQLPSSASSLKCSVCELQVMPGATFCDNCGSPIAPSIVHAAPPPLYSPSTSSYPPYTAPTDTTKSPSLTLSEVTTRLLNDDTQSIKLDKSLPVALLLQLDQEERGELIPLKKRTVIGRSELCDVVITDSSASKQHVLLTQLENEDVISWRVYDLASSNGLLIGEKTVTEAIIQHNDEITIGNTRFIFKRLDI